MKVDRTNNWVGYESAYINMHIWVKSWEAESGGIIFLPLGGQRRWVALKARGCWDSFVWREAISKFAQICIHTRKLNYVFLIVYFWKEGTHQTLLRVYSWLCIQGSHLVGLRDHHMGYNGVNLGELHAKQALYPLSYHSTQCWIVYLKKADCMVCEL